MMEGKGVLVSVLMLILHCHCSAQLKYVLLFCDLIFQKSSTLFILLSSPLYSILFYSVGSAESHPIISLLITSPHSSSHHITPYHIAFHLISSHDAQHIIAANMTSHNPSLFFPLHHIILHHLSHIILPFPPLSLTSYYLITECQKYRGSVRAVFYFQTSRAGYQLRYVQVKLSRNVHTIHHLFLSTS